MAKKKAVHFGAGLIGQGFIGQLLHDSGYEIVFADVVDPVVQSINEDGKYVLFQIDHDYAPIVIDDVRAINSAKDPDAVAAEIQDAAVVTTSVMATNLCRIAPLLAKALKERADAPGDHEPKAIVMACENAIMGTDILKKELLKTGEVTEEELDTVAVFPNTAVDRMVFAGEHDGVKGIEIGDAFELAIERGKLEDPDSEPIKGAEYVDDLMRYLQRKIYIINCGHAVAGYFGQRKGYTTLQEVLKDPELLAEVKGAMMESASALHEKYGFSMDELEHYMDTMMIQRWLTPGVVDELTRIARQPIRKIAPDDRILGPALQCEQYGLDNHLLLKAIACALKFQNPDDEQAVDLQNYIREHGVEDAITTFTGLEPDNRMFKVILDYYNQLA